MILIHTEFADVHAQYALAIDQMRGSAATINPTLVSMYRGVSDLPDCLAAQRAVTAITRGLSQSLVGMTIDWVMVAGTIGAGASVASFTPQAWKIIRSRSTEGLSLGMFALTCIAFAAWTTFGLLKGEWTLIIPNAICLGFALFILAMIALPRRKTREVAETLDPKH